MISYIKSIGICLLLVAFASCEEEKIYTHEFTEQQIAAKNLAGSWGQPYNIITPPTMPATLLDKVIVLFTVDEQGNPDGFLAENAADVFSENPGTWTWAEGGSTTDIVLSGVSPVSAITVKMESPTRINLSFEVTSANGRVQGLGSYQVSLVKL